MAVRRGGDSRLPMELKHLGEDERGIYWLEKYLKTQGVRLTQGREVLLSIREHGIALALQNSKNPALSVEQIRTEHRNTTVSDKHLQWIDQKNHRLLIWLLSEAWERLGKPDSADVAQTAQKFRPHIRTLLEVPSQERYSEVVRALDGWFVAASVKEEWIKLRQQRWGYLLEHDARYLKWLRGGNKSSTNQLNEAQLEWALQYLREHNQILALPRHHTVEELYGIVAATIDSFSLHPNTAEKTLFIEQMKKSWSQKKYRDAGKAKKPYHLPLTLDAKEKLDWLSNKTGYRTTDILAALINQEYEQYKKGRRWVLVEKAEE